MVWIYASAAARLDHPLPSRRTIALAGTLVTVAALAAPATASAAVPHNPTGSLEHVVRSVNTLTLTGWAADPDARSARLALTVTVDKRLVARAATGVARPDVARLRHVGPRSGFTTRVHVRAGRHTICVTAANAGPGRAARFGCRTITVPTANAAIAKLAAHYVGARYRTGGASPRGFDCSGLVQYVYAHAAHVRVTHYTQTQYQHAHRIPKSRARPGDLVFFLSGGYVYHVGIYAGGNMMWAAATPRDGVRHQTIWSSAVRFGSYTHT
jgi:cell wall-associated NlpC family hydrolase